MKPYFAELVPVEGEIKEGDWAISEGGVKYQLIDKMGGSTEGDKKLKLFLCSRDIQVGDKYFREGFSEELTAKEMLVFGEESLPDSHTHIEPVYKVIGEISPNAKWVKEGDEFDEYKSWIEETNPTFANQDYIMVKGPCGHFH